MRATDQYASVRKRERIRRVWTVLVPVSLTLYIVSLVLVAQWVSAVFMTAYGSDALKHLVSTPRMILLGASAVAAAASFLLYKIAKRKREQYIDTRFAIRAYPEVVKSLAKLGVKEPAVFLAKNPDHVSAYKKVKIAATGALDGYYNSAGFTRTQHAPGAITIFNEAHDIAMLIFPTRDTLAREHRLLDYVENRGVLKLDNIVALLKETDGQPNALTEGAL